MMDLEKFEEMGKELEKMYNEAVKVEDFEQVVKKRKEIERQISESDLHENPDFFGKILLHGYWGEYYWWLKGFIQQGKRVDEKKVKEFLKKVSWFWRTCKSDVAFGYGDLLSTAYDYLLNNKEASLKVFNDMKERAEKTKNRVALLRVINRSITSAMKYGDWQGAVRKAEEAKKLLPVEGEEELRHFGNIFNNQGAAKIRGNIDIFGGIKDLMRAVLEFYSKEKEPPWKHIIGVIDRLNEAKEKKRCDGQKTRGK